MAGRRVFPIGVEAYFVQGLYFVVVSGLMVVLVVGCGLGNGFLINVDSVYC